jgi:hypothetical protein
MCQLEASTHINTLWHCVLCRILCSSRGCRVSRCLMASLVSLPTQSDGRSRHAQLRVSSRSPSLSVLMPINFKLAAAANSCDKSTGLAFRFFVCVVLFFLSSPPSGRRPEMLWHHHNNWDNVERATRKHGNRFRSLWLSDSLTPCVCDNVKNLARNTSAL